MIAVVSVCFELLWGYLRTSNVQRIRGIIKFSDKYKKGLLKFLKDLNSLGVRTTWATVGGLMLDSRDEVEELLMDVWDEVSPLVKRYDARGLVDALYGYEVFLKALESGHEIGLHTYTHRVLKGLDESTVKYEIYGGVKAAKREGVRVVSFVFPSNVPSHIGVIKRFGIRICRGYNVKSRIPKPVRVEIREGMSVLPTSMLFDNPFPPPTLRSFPIMAKRFPGVLHISLHPEGMVDRPTLRLQFISFVRSLVRSGVSFKTMSEVLELEGYREEEVHI